jgi:hypothetical protein
MTAFISVRSPITSFAIVNLNGTVDWMVAQRQALLAWTGHALSISPTVNRKMVKALRPIVLEASELTVEEFGPLGQFICQWTGFTRTCRQGTGV